MRGNVNDSKRVSPYDLCGIAKLSGKPVSLTDSLSHSRRTPKELLERIASLESQLAARDALNKRIAELEAENERLSQLLHECKALEAENAELRDVIGDYRSDASRVLDEKCPSDERHCGCVPILRDQLNKYQKALILITTMPELSQATTIAREALQERGIFIWTEQSVGEYWVTKLDILQDQYDALEKDYADVCQKRLEAADVFSRQIIELESENAELEAALVSSGNQQGLYLEELFDLRKRIAELEAERRWIPVSEKPTKSDWYLIMYQGYGVPVAGYYHVDGGWLSDIPDCWMPLPEPPEMAEDAWRALVKRWQRGEGG